MYIEAIGLEVSSSFELIYVLSWILRQPSAPLFLGQCSFLGQKVKECMNAIKQHVAAYWVGTSKVVPCDFVLCLPKDEKYKV